MLDTLFEEINADIQKEQEQKDFKMLMQENTFYEDALDETILNLSENGVSDEMLKNEMPFLFIEDTVVDDELITNLQNEVDYEDNFNKKPIEDNNETTDFQEPVDFKDDFSTQYASDAESDTELTKEVDYNDHQTTPVNIDEFSNEAAELLFEMGDILGALEVLEEAEECDGTLLQTNCPNESDEIPQADEADIDDSCYHTQGSLVEPVGEDSEELFEDFDLDEDFDFFESSDEISDDDMKDMKIEEDFSLDEEFDSLFESSDEDEKDDSDDEDEDEEDDSDDEDEEDDDSSKAKDESFFNWFD